jgi:hypothetical protein
MVKVMYSLKGLLKGSQRFLEQVNDELGGKNTDIKQALERIKNALKLTQNGELEALVEYRLTLDETLEDTDIWDNQKEFPNMIPPKK